MPFLKFLIRCCSKQLNLTLIQASICRIFRLHSHHSHDQKASTSHLACVPFSLTVTGILKGGALLLWMFHQWFNAAHQMEGRDREKDVSAWIFRGNFQYIIHRVVWGVWVLMWWMLFQSGKDLVFLNLGSLQPIWAWTTLPNVFWTLHISKNCNAQRQRQHGQRVMLTHILLHNSWQPSTPFNTAGNVL